MTEATRISVLGLLLATGAIAAPGLTTNVEAQSVSVIPAPARVVSGAGEFRLTRETRVNNEVPDFAPVVARQANALERSTGFDLTGPLGSDPAITITRRPSITTEGYALEIAPDGVTIGASSEAGVFYAFQTLRQLLPEEIESTGRVDGIDWVIPSLIIEDSPRFEYRGLHLDVGRHFFDVEFVKRYIDTMSRFKLNRFHWHLTEDQGWRLEIDAYPRLTEFGAWRAESPVAKNLNPYVGDGIRHGGFYTKDEVRDVLAYAAERFVTVIPEIEMPGHATAAIASYPELGCTGEALEVSTTWGVHDTILCPGEETFEFLRIVLDEVMDLFPSEHIHIGGDEVPRRQWRESALARELMTREGLADADELQSWFIRRIERHLRANGRRLIGWDEILDGGLAPDATVMSWRGTAGGIAAARAGHDVIMTPVRHTYFDFYQGDQETEPLAMSWAGFPITLEQAYAFEPIPPELTAAEARHILGAQGNLWTEYIATENYAEYMAFPRALALAEVVWSTAAVRDWDGFVGRLGGVLRHLDVLGIDYRMPEEIANR